MEPESKEDENIFSPFEPTNSGQDESKEDPLEDLEDFDPFKVGASSDDNEKVVNVEGNVEESDNKTSTALPPRMDVRFKVHEEISSRAFVNTESEGASDIFVEGTVLAQVTSSDALKNSPFILVASSPTGIKVNFTPNETFAKSYASKGESNQVNVIKIPKSMVGFVTVGKFKFGEEVNHMPMLLERKISRAKAKIQVALQVRSKLSNPDDLLEFSIALSMSDKVDSDSIEINVGNGEWDRMTRTVVWKLDQLPRGESFMVSVRAKLTAASAAMSSPELKFPVMMRCKCKDQISSAEFQAIEASGYPATVSSATIQRTYRIVHRLE